MFFNFHKEELELKYQLAMFASLDLVKIKMEMKDNEDNGHYKGLLMPFYEFDIDLGVYGFEGNNGMKVLVIKRLEKENGSSEMKLQVICKEIYLKFNKLLLNPFYNKNEFLKTNSDQRLQFSNDIINFITQNQII